jgi:CubicO group peptidase (beta-lactamase class C family)
VQVYFDLDGTPDVIMKKLILFAAAIIPLITGCKSEETDSHSKLTRFADSLFKAEVDSSEIAGASVMIYQNGKKLLDKAYGYASLELSVPMPEHASFEIGSVTKQFTAAAVLRLASQGKLALDDNFTKYLDFDTKGRTVTIRHLLNHTSGIQSYTEIPEFASLAMLSLDRDTLVRIVEKKEFVFEPGEALIYNNSAYFFLGLIIMKASGMSYIDYLTEEFFKPLGMTNTYYCSSSEVVKNEVYGYSYSKGGLRQKEYLDHTWPFAGGSLCSTTEDLLTWLRALHEGKVFDESQYLQLTKPDTLNDGSPLRYAFGISNYSLFGNKLIGHTGGTFGFSADTRYFPDADLYMICLVNTTGPRGASYFTNELTWKILSRKEQTSEKLDVDLQPLEGNYKGQARGRVLSVQVKVSNNVILLVTEGKKEVDTLKTYVGNRTWLRGNDRITIDDNKVSIDHVGGHYILKKL